VFRLIFRNHYAPMECLYLIVYCTCTLHFHAMCVCHTRAKDAEFLWNKISWIGLSNRCTSLFISCKKCGRFCCILWENSWLFLNSRMNLNPKHSCANISGTTPWSQFVTCKRTLLFVYLDINRPEGIQFVSTIHLMARFNTKYNRTFIIFYGKTSSKISLRQCWPIN